jgi:two-component system, OmpR family, sensor kinase
MSLRRRVVLGMVAVAIVLGVAGFTITSTLRSYLLNRVDDQLSKVEPQRFLQPRPRDSFDNELAFIITDLNGTVIATKDPGLQHLGDPLPDVSGVLPGPPDAPDLRYQTVRSVGPGSVHYRVKLNRFADVYTAVGVSLKDTDKVFHRIQLVEILASTGVLLALALSGWWVLRQGVRPLRQIAGAADKIAEGDLTHRVPVDDDRTEAGRLGRALNRMLGEIESSFRRKEESEDRLKRFVGDASHELRTPLTSIRGYADLWRQGGLEEPARLTDAMGRLESEAERMGRLVDDLLLLARLDEGRPLARDRIDLVRTVAAAVADARVTGPDHPIELTGLAEATVIGDADRLYQVVANLLANTRRHTPAGTSVHLTVEREGENILVHVADNGPGLDPTTAEHVFERFYRADPARARATGGTGLGLAIGAAIMQAHEGTVSVSSKPGEGATFTIAIPAASLSPPP